MHILRATPGNVDGALLRRLPAASKVWDRTTGTSRENKGDSAMSKRVRSKYKINRRLGCNPWGRPKSLWNAREYGPGQHGQRRRSKMSDFGLQLQAKQKLKGYYGSITEKQFRRILQ